MTFSRRGSMLSTSIFMYAATAPVNGYFGGSLYARMGGKCCTLVFCSILVVCSLSVCMFMSLICLMPQLVNYITSSGSTVRCDNIIVYILDYQFMTLLYIYFLILFSR